MSDSNQHLMDAFRYLRQEPEIVSGYLTQHAIRNSEEYYYRVRDEYNASDRSAAQAARFIYLNRTCFNGIFRVNMGGKFNVPYGFRKSPAIPSSDELRLVSDALRTADLQDGDYIEVLSQAARDDVVYLDPPYPPLNGTSFFTHYTKERFSGEDQQTVAEEAERLREIGCRVIVSNADTNDIRHLYRSWHIRSFAVRRWITCKATKHQVSELLITSYPLEITSDREGEDDPEAGT